ncbi:Zinc finger CCCH domain-containing protein 13 [Quillaja saponaria]|uniref:Zinc finger CCCH domain-containing protein 13 n=1 Tax=Quillaja saponaria TaxID=32244 RepID=A0AAD7PAJ7_QUISA|nr:Zinc finger CCCH domain-containing protein 13 [Quillaja saponaria]
MGSPITIHYYLSLVVPCNGRRDNQGSDLRDKLDRRRVTPRRYSPARDERNRRTIREYSSSRSFERSVRKYRRKHVNGQSGISRNLKNSDGIQDRLKEGKALSSGSRDAPEEQLKKVQMDISMLEHHKCQLGVYLKERDQEAESLNSRIQELEAQLCKENEDCKRITSKIRKFVKAHNRTSRIQDELKRSQVRLQTLGEQLGSDISKISANEEDLSIDIVSNGESGGYPLIIRNNMEQKDAFPDRKMLHIDPDAVEGSKQDKAKGHLVETIRPRKRSRWNVTPELNNDKVVEGLEAANNRIDVHKPIEYQGKHKRGNANTADYLSSDKLKGLESGIAAPSTSMAAHAVEEEVEIELDDKTEIDGTGYTGLEKGAAFVEKALPLMLLPPLVPYNNYSLYEGNNENVDVDGLDEDMVHVDIV